MKTKIPGFFGRTVFLAGFFMIIGGFGHIDMLTEMHQQISPAQEIMSYLISVLGFPVAYVGYKLIEKYDTGM